MVAGGPVLWLSVKQPVVALSTAEAELTALVSAVKEAIWLRRVNRAMGEAVAKPTIIYCDNVAAIEIAKQDNHKRRTKHVEIYYHFVTDEIVTFKSVSVVYVPSALNLADILTKASKKTDYLSMQSKILAVVYI
jgi:hypothetical protein